MIREILKILIDNCTFQNFNNSFSYGGALYFSGISIVSLFNNLFQSNSARFGGAIYLENMGIIYLF